MKALLLAAAFTVSATAAPQKVSPPVDQIARDKFPGEPGAEIDALALINKVINEAITYQDDQSHYGIGELWVMFPADGKGDCEDYALTKLGVLSEDGFPIVTNAKVVSVIVHHPRDASGSTGDGHAILAVLLPGGDVAYLDSLNGEPMTRSELIEQGYQFFDWRA